ncbi:hypothetical protein GX830_01260, partial [Candidatus Dojkabacteria bacterium]|nr:hypothetical protein [Candidatus Dojkabacteria bacterium]
IDANEKRLTIDGNVKRIAKVIEGDEIRIRPVIEVKIKISGEIKSIETVIVTDSIYPVVLGKNDLKGYLIDTSKTFK